MSSPSSVHRPQTTRHLAQLRAFADGSLPGPPIAESLGLRATRVDLGAVLMEMDVGERFFNQMGTVAGGIVCDLADAAMGTAMATTLEDHETFASVDLTAKFLKAVREARLGANAEVIKRTRTLGLVECAVTDEDQKLVAKAYSTCIVLRGEPAQRR